MEVGHIADRLIDERARKGWTQEELAQRSGTSPTTISNLESRQIKRPQYRTLRKLAGALGVDVAALYGEEVLGPKAPALSLEWALDPRVSDEEYRAAMARAKVEAVEDYTRLRRQLRQQSQWVEVEPATTGGPPQKIKVLHPLVVERLRAAPPITLFEMKISNKGNKCRWFIPPEQWGEHRETVDDWFGDKPYVDVDARGHREEEQEEAEEEVQASKEVVYA